MIPSFDENKSEPLVTRIKILANLNIAEKRIPQDGKIITRVDGTDVDLRVSILPIVNGEKIVIRILKREGYTTDKKKLGMNEENLAKLEKLISAPNGIILVTGPTGSGKSTTLYTVLSELNTDDVNIVTVEDPVEYSLSGINQVSVNNKAGLTFASGLRSILRQDPDIIMIGEIRDNETAEIVKYALECGYRQIDTASFYNNEVGIGNGIKESGIDRKDIFIVTKLWNDDHGYDNTIEAFNKSLNNLQVDYIDLYLIHWPNKLNAETWRAFEHLYETGKVKAIGVCNFKVEHLEELKKTAKIMPMVNQVEIHPFSTKNNIINYCKDNNIKVVAWSPISRGRVLSNELMIDLSQKYKKSIVQIVLRWHMQKGVIPIPKSSNENRIKENIDIFDFEISSEDMKAIDSLDEGDDMSVTTPPLNTIYEEVR